jgi:poly(3-hydroxybutyrate) depolymerase
MSCPNSKPMYVLRDTLMPPLNKSHKGNVNKKYVKHDLCIIIPITRKQALIITMSQFYSLLFLSLSAGLSAVGALEANAPQTPQSLTDTICNGRPRESCDVELDVPAACVAGDNEEDPSCPIVFFLHGAGGTNGRYARTTNVHDAGYIGVYPQGEGGWNTGPKDSNNCSWDDFDCTQDPDEGDFIASIISEVRTQGATGNVYAIGNSNGAALAHRLAANAGTSLPIKGIVAKVTQLLASPERSGPGVLNYNQPRPGNPAVSVLSVMGTDDGLIPYDGGSSAVFSGDDSFALMSTLDSMSTWADHNGCDGSTIISHDYSTDQGTGEATKYDYTAGCPSGIILEHYAIHGGGHNSGNVIINGEKVNYVIAYDFIDRVENGSVSAPNPSPVASPVASPVSAPVAPPIDTSCQDDPDWAGKFSSAHTCDYIAQNPDRRCGWENSQGVKAKDACLLACSDDCSGNIFQ